MVHLGRNLRERRKSQLCDYDEFTKAFTLQHGPWKGKKMVLIIQNLDIKRLN